MRAVDFWIGIPLCFALTIVSRLQRLLGFGRIATDSPRNILFIQLAEMGTMVVAYPSLRKARELFPDATFHFLCFGQIRSSVEMLDIVEPDNIITIDERTPTSLVRDTLRFCLDARRRRIDTVVNMEAFVRYSTVAAYLSGASRRIGFHRFNQEGLYTGDLVTHKVWYNAHVHAAHTFLDLVHAIEAPQEQVPRVKRPAAMDRLDVPKITTDTATEAAIWRKLQAINPEIDDSRTLVIVNPNASHRFPRRRLPLESFVELVRKLLEDPSLFVLITGVASEKPDARFICERAGSSRVLDLTGATTMKELLHLFDLAEVLVSNDSGPAHFACLTRVHVIVFFGPEIPERYGPLTANLDTVHTGFTCSPCIGPHNQRLSPCNDNLCMKSISMERAAELVRRRLRERSSSASAQMAAKA
jgi:ADP-heptose:LPS heptosyltransferase